uniref:Uncharacterized protein n=1 Tax=Mimivirus LCMiAC01 TaxID=2506608 RepID=A0A481Z0K2_9VIRU|nr:MAG: hypothetical protein LCMiAC01_03690 [Mimivirus LCMiAC01]
MSDTIIDEIDEKMAEAVFGAVLSNIIPGTDNIEIKRLKKRIKTLYIITGALLILLVVVFIIIIVLILTLSPLC